jgi:hypothetical protein
MSEKKKLEKITTPIGVAKYPRLNKPETEINGTPCEPRFKITLVLDEKDKGVPELKAHLEKLHAEAVAVAEKKRKADPKRAKKPLKVNDVIKPHLDDEGNEVEGKFEITAKTNAETKDGTPKTVRMFDAKGKPVKAKVGEGSRVKVSVSPDGYDSNLGAGLSLYLNAVQIIELCEFGGGNAGSYGFGEEEGYEGSDEDDSSTDGDGDGDGNADDSVPDDAATETGKPRAKGDF